MAVTWNKRVRPKEPLESVCTFLETDDAYHVAKWTLNSEKQGDLIRPAVIVRHYIPQQRLRPRYPLASAFIQHYYLDKPLILTAVILFFCLIMLNVNFHLTSNAQSAGHGRVLSLWASAKESMDMVLPASLANRVANASRILESHVPFDAVGRPLKLRDVDAVITLRQSLGAALHAPLASRIHQYVLSHAQAEGGSLWGLAISHPSRGRTRHSLCLAHGMNLIDKTKQTSWIQDRISSCGGFFEPWMAKPDLQSTFHAIEALRMLGPQEIPLSQLHAEWALKKWRNGRRGWIPTCLTIKILAGLNGYDAISARELGEHLAVPAGTAVNLPAGEVLGRLCETVSSAELLMQFGYVEAWSVVAEAKQRLAGEVGNVAAKSCARLEKLKWANMMGAFP